MASDWFSIVEHGEARVIELRMPEQLDSTYLDQVIAELLKEIAANESRVWVIDLAKMRYVGSAVLGLMVNVRHKVMARGGTLALCNVNKQLSSVLHVSALDRLFTIRTSR